MPNILFTSYRSNRINQIENKEKLKNDFLQYINTHKGKGVNSFGFISDRMCRSINYGSSKEAIRGWNIQKLEKLLTKKYLKELNFVFDVFYNYCEEQIRTHKWIADGHGYNRYCEEIDETDLDAFYEIYKTPKSLVER